AELPHPAAASTSAAKSAAAARALIAGMVDGRRSDFYGPVPDELRDVPGRDEHGVDARPLEREHGLAGGDRDLGDRELAGRDVGEELEHDLDRVGVVVVGAPVREQEDL